MVSSGIRGKKSGDNKSLPDGRGSSKKRKIDTTDTARQNRSEKRVRGLD